MLSTQDIRAVIDSDDPTTIAAALAADPRTRSNISVPHLRPLLSQWGLRVRHPVTREYGGQLLDLYLADGTPEPLRHGIALLLDHLTEATSEYVRTADSVAWAAMWHAVVAMLDLTDSQRATLAALHGGLRFRHPDGTPYTVNEIESVLAADAIDRTTHAVNARWIAATNAAVLAAANGSSAAAADAAGLAVIGGA